MSHRPLALLLCSSALGFLRLLPPLQQQGLAGWLDWMACGSSHFVNSLDLPCCCDARSLSPLGGCWRYRWTVLFISLTRGLHAERGQEPRHIRARHGWPMPHPPGFSRSCWGVSVDADTSFIAASLVSSLVTHPSSLGVPLHPFACERDTGTCDP